MAQNNYFIKKLKNHDNIKKFHQNQNQFLFLNEWKKSLIQKYKIRSLNEPGNKEIFDKKTVNINISISEVNRRVQECQYYKKNDRQVNQNCKKNTFCQFQMKQESRFSFSVHQKDNNSGKQNMMSLSNSLKNDNQGKLSKSFDLRNEKVKQLQQRLSQAHFKAAKNFNNLQSQSFNVQEPQPNNTNRLQLINKLISMLQTNKNIRIRSMFEQRQLISQLRAQQKRQCMKKLQRINQIENKVKSRKMSEYSAIREIDMMQYSSQQ